MLCNRCGTPLNPSAKFCPQCGTPVMQGQVHYDCGIRKRDIATCIILSVVTLGIYGIYWFIKMVDEVNRVCNDREAFSGGVTWLLSLLSCGIYGWYWYYQAGKKMNYAKQVRNMRTESSAEVLYLLLAVFRVSIVARCLIQNDLNKMA